MYLDDGLGTNFDCVAAVCPSKQVKNDLLASGFVPKNDKSLWDPIQTLVFLGVNLDTCLGIMKIPDHRMHKALNCLSHILCLVKRDRPIHIKTLAKFVGHLISMSIILGNVTQLMSKYVSIDIARAQSWNEHIQLADGSIRQLKFWSEHLGTLNQCPINYHPQCYRVVYSDASSTGYGGYCVESPGGVAHGLWNDLEASKSST